MQRYRKDLNYQTSLHYSFALLSNTKKSPYIMKRYISQHQKLLKMLSMTLGYGKLHWRARLLFFLQLCFKDTIIKILLTGATGFLGSNLAKFLLDNGHSLVVLKRSFSNISSKVKFYDIDCCQIENRF
ncbi:MAG: NAD-dependent epimerase/dehydratase family protein [Endomicrobium sp.]|jgi:hypothetical protein|nr:NAD-dependent epimerase/dehydratase family protein [Endomicrobium sp.]